MEAIWPDDRIEARNNLSRFLLGGGAPNIAVEIRLIFVIALALGFSVEAAVQVLTCGRNVDKSVDSTKPLSLVSCVQQ